MRVPSKCASRSGRARRVAADSSSAATLLTLMWVEQPVGAAPCRRLSRAAGEAREHRTGGRTGRAGAGGRGSGRAAGTGEGTPDGGRRAVGGGDVDVKRASRGKGEAEERERPGVLLLRRRRRRRRPLDSRPVCCNWCVWSRETAPSTQHQAPAAAAGNCSEHAHAQLQP
jgi:hypothetical protein